MQTRETATLSAPVASGILAVLIAFVAMSITSGLENLFADQTAILMTLGFLVLAFTYGWTLGALIEETYWFRSKISPLKYEEIRWGWLGIIGGVLVSLFQRGPWTPVSYSLLIMVLVSFIIWVGPFFSLLLFNARTVKAMVPGQSEQ